MLYVVTPMTKQILRTLQVMKMSDIIKAIIYFLAIHIYILLTVSICLFSFGLITVKLLILLFDIIKSIYLIFHYFREI